MTEEALVFECGDAELVGILHRPQGPPAPRAVLVVVGGPQYRVGSHRQFLLLARDLAAAGFAVLRFDYRGMGDSSGPAQTFKDIDGDIAAALDALFARVPETREAVIWGLCDAASAAAFYAAADPRVTGLVLLNPWVRSEQGIARSYLRRYYAQRLLSGDFWGKVLKGRFRPVDALRSFGGMLGRAVGRGGEGAGAAQGGAAARRRGGTLAEQMLDGLQRFRGRVLVILSGDDLTAGEFKDAVAASTGWQRLMDEGRVSRQDYPEADHTFSTRKWRDQVSAWTREWLSSW